MEERKRSNEGTRKKRGGGNATSVERVAGLLKLLKDNKILSFEGEGVKLVMSPIAYMDDIDMSKFNLTDEQRKQMENEAMYDAVGGN